VRVQTVGEHYRRLRDPRFTRTATMFHVSFVAAGAITAAIGAWNATAYLIHHWKG
jgi:hypothetical protein